MFGAIAHRYDFLNHFLSLNIDQRWRRFAVRQIALRLGRDDFEALDLACGTGDLTAALRSVTRGRVVGMDFCHPMLIIGFEKLVRRKNAAPVAFTEADALELPIGNSTFDVVTIAFGLRNLEDFEKGLREMHRVLRQRGIVAVLEFSRPKIPLFRQLYHLYFTRLLPRIGTWLSGVSGPYSYLPDSVSKFPSPGELQSLLEKVGFVNVEFLNLSGGIATLHLGRKK